MSVCELSARVVPGDSKCEAYLRAGSVTCRYCDLKVVELKKVEDPMAKDKCSVEDCNVDVHARGMCWKHERSVLGINPANGKPLEKVKAPKPVPAAVKNLSAHVAAEKVTKQVEKAKALKSLPTAAAVAAEVFAHTEKVQVKEVVEPVVERSAAAPGLVMTDMDMELDQLFKAKRTEWLYDLANTAGARKRAETFLSMCDSLEGMVY